MGGTALGDSTSPATACGRGSTRAVAALDPPPPTPADGRRPRRLRRQRRRPGPPRGRQADPGGLEVAARAGPDRAGPGRTAASPACSATRCARRSGSSEQGISDDIVIAYPTVDRAALERLVASPSAAGRDHADGRRRRPTSTSSTRSAPRRPSPVRVAHRHRRRPADGRPARRAQALAAATTSRTSSRLARTVRRARRASRLVGVMTYEGQVAGVPDDVPTQRAKSLVVRRLKSASMAQLAERRRVIADRAGRARRRWSSGTPGARARSRRPPPTRSVTEIAAGSGLLVPGAVRPLPVVHAAAGGVLRAAGRRRALRRDGDRARRRLHRLRAGRRRPAAGAVGSARPAPDRARGRRRGADPADRSPGRAAARSATWCGSGTPSPASCSSTPTPCTCWRATPSSTRCRPTAAAGTPGEQRPGRCSDLRRWSRRAHAGRAAGWSASTARPARARPRSPRRSRADAGRRCCTWTTCSRAGTGCPAITDQLDDAAAPARRRPVRAATAAGTGPANAGPRRSWCRRHPCWCSRASARARRSVAR